MSKIDHDKVVGRGFFHRLARNQAGNALMIVAAAIIPLLGLVGGGIDMSRLYLTQARLQQACDAGALAGRKQMGAGAWSANNGKANEVALQLFDANFGTDPYGTSGTTRSFAESNRKVTGTASVTVPMTVMRALGQPSKTLHANCEAEMRIPNTDVMFVLDVTGSMSSKANSSDSLSKIDGLKKAVKCFYEALAKLDTTADCGSTPSGGNSSSAQLRFGFVPYSVNVNVGKLLNNDWIADNWTYQSRTYGWDGKTYTDNNSEGSWAYVSGTNPSTTISGQSSCNPPSDTMTQSTSSSNSSSTATDGTITIKTTTVRITNGIDYSGCTSSGKGSNKTYSYTKTTYTNYKEQKVDTTTRTPLYTYTYQPVTFSVASLKAGGTDNNEWNGSISLPVSTAGANKSITWNGCIEERQTVRATTYYPIPADAYDLDIDMAPNKADSRTQWGPLLPGAQFSRSTYDPVVTTTNSNSASAACPVEAKKLQPWPSASTFETYINSLSPTGNTYHDIGMLWGARLASPTGIFKSENATTSTGGQIERHIIFMTDGETNTSTTDVTAYGMPWWDRRQTSISVAPSDNDTDAQVNARFTALCTAVKNKGFTVWTIYFGVTVTSSSSQTVKDTAARLKSCASDDQHAFTAANSTTLIDNFKDIADNISQLRLTQ
ncbi:MAG: pilus assembly protein [Sphingobium sp.]